MAKKKINLWTKPEAWLPFFMSLSALILLMAYVALVGVHTTQDEGGAAHLFQLIMALQTPVIIYFAIKWIPRQPKDAYKILVAQLVAFTFPFALVFFLEM